MICFLASSHGSTLSPTAIECLHVEDATRPQHTYKVKYLSVHSTYDWNICLHIIRQIPSIGYHIIPYTLYCNIPFSWHRIFPTLQGLYSVQHVRRDETSSDKNAQRASRTGGERKGCVLTHLCGVVWCGVVWCVVFNLHFVYFVL